MPLMKEKRISLGIAELTVAMEASRAERLRRTFPYQKVVRPALGWLQHRGTNQNGHTSAATQAPSTPQVAGPITPEAQAILDRIKGIDWYHSIDLPHGVSTSGYVDHRQQVHYYGLPEDMRGMRALDVATYDGFWAFEMERRGAEVVSIDLESLAQCDFPRRFRDQALSAGAQAKLGASFYLAKELLGSRVQREILRSTSCRRKSSARLTSFS
ncbi:MAG TPA: hypothetical protein VMW65_07705 [Chloroflexota bacterium]|nr:hypothetical protein [Chloroflexota bacterium]